MTPIIDIHTHHLDADGALISVAPQDFDPQPGKWYSVGFHPWDTNTSLNSWSDVPGIVRY